MGKTAGKRKGEGRS